MIAGFLFFVLITAIASWWNGNKDQRQQTMNAVKSDFNHVKQRSQSFVQEMNERSAKNAAEFRKEQAAKREAYMSQFVKDKSFDPNADYVIHYPTARYVPCKGTEENPTHCGLALRYDVEEWREATSSRPADWRIYSFCPEHGYITMESNSSNLFHSEEQARNAIEINHFWETAQSQKFRDDIHKLQTKP